MWLDRQLAELVQGSDSPLFGRDICCVEDMQHSNSGTRVERGPCGDNPSEDVPLKVCLAAPNPVIDRGTCDPPSVVQLDTVEDPGEREVFEPATDALFQQDRLPGTQQEFPEIIAAQSVSHWTTP